MSGEGELLQIAEHADAATMWPTGWGHTPLVNSSDQPAIIVRTSTFEAWLRLCDHRDPERAGWWAIEARWNDGVWYPVLEQDWFASPGECVVALQHWDAEWWMYEPR